jgi:pyrroloquinoline-quinone synthase
MSDRLLQSIDRILIERSMLAHPFYEKWNQGALSRDHLRQYAAQYDHFVREFPRMVSAVHSNVPDLAVRRTLLENLMEEEGVGNEDHPTLWRRFAMALGTTPAELEATTPLESTRALVNTMMASARDEAFPVGVAALYAYEAQIPEVSKVKIHGLEQFYGINDPAAIQFFTVHEVADVHHSTAERDLIRKHTPADLEARVAESARRTAKALWEFLDGVEALAA